MAAIMANTRALLTRLAMNALGNSIKTYSELTNCRTTTINKLTTLFMASARLVELFLSKNQLSQTLD